MIFRRNRNASGDASGFVNNGVVDLMTAGAGTTIPVGFSNGENGIVLGPELVKAAFFEKPADAFVVRIDGYAGHRYRLQRSDDASGGSFADVVGVPAQIGRGRGRVRR